MAGGYDRAIYRSCHESRRNYQSTTGTGFTRIRIWAGICNCTGTVGRECIWISGVSFWSSGDSSARSGRERTGKPDKRKYRIALDYLRARRWYFIFLCRILRSEWFIKSWYFPVYGNRTKLYSRGERTVWLWGRIFTISAEWTGAGTGTS